jgi:hypothetical protein
VMPGLKLTNFKGIFEKGGKFDLPDVFAETCKDFVCTHEGVLKKRLGYTQYYFGGNPSGQPWGLSGNVINMFELTTGRSDTSAPNEAVKYLCQTDYQHGKIFVWDDLNGAWVQIDNNLTDFRDANDVVQKCTFLEENGVVRILAGNQLANKSLWWGWCGQQFTGGIFNNEKSTFPIDAGFLTTAQLATIVKPVTATYFSAKAITSVNWTEDTCLAWTTAAYVRYRISLQYDNKQWSPPSNPVTAEDESTKFRVAVRVSFPYTLDRRITGIKIYRADQAMAFRDRGGAEWTVGEDYRLIKHININQLYNDPLTIHWPCGRTVRIATFTLSTLTFSLDGTVSGDDALANDLYNTGALYVYDTVTGDTYLCYITDTYYNSTTDQGFVVSSSLLLVNNRKYRVYVVESWYYRFFPSNAMNFLFIDDLKTTVVDGLPALGDDLAISDESYTDTQAKHGTIINGQVFYGNVYNNGERKEYLVTYGQLTPDGLFANDVHLKLNAFSAGRPVVGMSSVGNRLLLYGNAFISRGIIPSGNESSWTYERLFEKFGLLAEYSLVNINGKDYFLATDWDIKVFDGVTPPVSIGGGIYDTLHTVGTTSLNYLTGVVGFFIPKLNSYGVRLQTSPSTYEYWLYEISGKLGWIQFNWYDVFNGFFIDRHGEAIGYTNETVFQLHSGTSDNGNYIAPIYKSLPLAMSRDSIVNIESLAYHIKSGTTFTFNLFTDDSGSGISLLLMANTADKLKSHNMAMGTQGRSVQVMLSLPSTQQAKNKQFDIDELELAVKLSGDKNE